MTPRIENSGTIRELDWAVAATPFPGEAESGDAHLVLPYEGGVLIAAVDGLGHGREATTAARIAIDVLRRYVGESVIALMRHCHQALLNSRGAVISMAMLSMMDETVTWIGVGNVDGILAHSYSMDGVADAILQRQGVVGHELPPLRATVVPVSHGDTLVLATDGIRSGYVEAVEPHLRPQAIAGRIIEEYCTGTDDALVLVARWLGGGEWPRADGSPARKQAENSAPSDP